MKKILIGSVLFGLVAAALYYFGGPFSLGQWTAINLALLAANVIGQWEMK